MASSPKQSPTSVYAVYQIMKSGNMLSRAISPVVTTNARDFIKLLNLELHPGLIVLRQSGLSREEQWAALLPVIEHIKASGDDNLLVNKLVEITNLGRWEIREIPKPGRPIRTVKHTGGIFFAFPGRIFVLLYARVIRLFYSWTTFGKHSA